MNTGKILITGATGDTGGYAIEQLLQKGHEVRALVHRIDDRSRRFDDKGVEVVAGDYLDLGAMRTAVKGVRRAYFVFPIRPGIIQATAYFAQAAREAGVEAIANMSQISAREDAGATPPGTTGSPSGYSTGRGSPSRTCGRHSSPSGCSTTPQ
jgi:NAD(P)H dehydrogenase (quinone)